MGDKLSRDEHAMRKAALIKRLAGAESDRAARIRSAINVIARARHDGGRFLASLTEQKPATVSSELDALWEETKARHQPPVSKPAPIGKLIDVLTPGR
jgi:hypothetical protein